MEFKTLNVRFEGKTCFVQIDRPSSNNTINKCLIDEFNELLKEKEDEILVIVISGSPEVFCFGADFNEIASNNSKSEKDVDPEDLYNFWLKLTSGAFISVAYVQGRVNAGGVGFVAACDIVVSDYSSNFSLSELLFGLYPACVLPFLIRKIGFQKSNYLTLSTRPIDADEAYKWGLIDCCGDDGRLILKNLVRRLNCISKNSIRSYKNYLNKLYSSHFDLMNDAVNANRTFFLDESILLNINRFVNEGLFPWE